MSMIEVCEINCDSCGEVAYYGTPNNGFIAGNVYCKKCAKKMIKEEDALLVA